MAEDTSPSTATLWRLLQEEQAHRQQLAAQVRRLGAELERVRLLRPARGGTGTQERGQAKLSRAGLLGAAGLAGVALAGSRATGALADNPPPIPSLTTFASPARVMSLAMNNGDTSPAISALTTITSTSTGVPAGAQAIYASVQAYDSGVLTLFPDGAADPGVANWAQTGASGQLKMLYMLVPLSAAGAFRVHAYFSSTIYIDVWAFVF